MNTENGLFELLEQQIQHASTSTIANFATIAKKSSEIEDGANRCYFNKVNKCLTLKYGNKPVTECLQLGTANGTINNVESITFNNNTSLKGLINDLETQLTDLNNYSPSVSAIKTELLNYASINHNHDSSYAAIIHNHDERYALLSNISSEIQNITSENNKIPTIQAVKSFCSDFLTPTTLANNSQLQNLIRGKSAFDVWAEQQPIRYDENDPTLIVPYTFEEYLEAITGPQGEQGETGEDGLSAYEVWLSTQQPTLDENNNPVYPSVQDFIDTLTGENFLEWYARIRELNVEEITWESLCQDIVESASVSDGENSFSILDGLEILFGIGEGVATGGMEAQIQGLTASIGTLQGQIFVLQGAVGSILSRTVADDVIDVGQSVSNVNNVASNLTGTTGSNIIDSISNIGNSFETAFNNQAPALNSISSNLSGLSTPLILT